MKTKKITPIKSALLFVVIWFSCCVVCSGVCAAFDVSPRDFHDTTLYCVIVPWIIWTILKNFKKHARNVAKKLTAYLIVTAGICVALHFLFVKPFWAETGWCIAYAIIWGTWHLFLSATEEKIEELRDTNDENA